MATYRVALLAAVCAVASDALQATGPKLASRARLRAANDAADDDAAGEPPKDAVEYVFGKPGEFERDMALLGTNPRRLLLFGSLALGIAGVGDLFGVTSALLTASPPPVKAFASKTRLDTYYLVGPLRRYVDDEFGFEVKYPRAWLGDQAVYVARTQNRARALATDPSGDAFIKAGRSRRGPAAVAAFGPAAGTFAENLSVFSATVPGVSLAALGASPAAAAQRLLDVSIAPPSSGKTAALLAASARPDGLFAFEYTLALPTRRDGAPGAVLHNLAVAAARPDELLTCTILCKEDDWPDREAAFREAAASFKLTR